MDTPVIIALASAATAVIAVIKGIADHLARTREQAQVDGVAIRGDLQKRVKFLEEQREKDLAIIAGIRAVIDEWQERYYEKDRENALLKAKVTALELETSALRTEMSRLRTRLAHYEQEQAQNGATD